MYEDVLYNVENKLYFSFFATTKHCHFEISFTAFNNGNAITSTHTRYRVAVIGGSGAKTLANSSEISFYLWSYYFIWLKKGNPEANTGVLATGVFITKWSINLFI